MSWKGRAGWVLAKAVLQVGDWSSAPRRPMNDLERKTLHGIFRDTLDTNVIEVREALTGLINVSRRAFVIENTMHLPMPVGRAPMHLIVHEATHVWQFQNGGHAYITDSLHAQTLGDGYQLEKGLLQGKAWAQLNCVSHQRHRDDGLLVGAQTSASWMEVARTWQAEKSSTSSTHSGASRR